MWIISVKLTPRKIRFIFVIKKTILVPWYTTTFFFSYFKLNTLFFCFIKVKLQTEKITTATSAFTTMDYDSPSLVYCLLIELNLCSLGLGLCALFGAFGQNKPFNSILNY